MSENAIHPSFQTKHSHVSDDAGLRLKTIAVIFVVGLAILQQAGALSAMYIEYEELPVLRIRCSAS